MDIKSFSDELKLLVVDKLLFGGLVFACVFLVQSEYEQFNNERAFKIEVTKITWALTDTSISKLNTCSEQLAATILHVYQGATLSSIDRNKAYENIMCIELQSEALASHLDTNINGEETELISELQITSSVDQKKALFETFKSRQVERINTIKQALLRKAEKEFDQKG